ncbi:exported hypothetical protein [Mesorhizobium metallidurans STM 2683]|uniref:Uncharacterized protein n=1 Tax=Mesorhizobium metallidurans STM 2683 TaxID=1297569 RepID=M5EGX9_9HYPH|nr:exported hypothetical protein [Mesorhizobium metallidurans STM 2683]
MTPRVIALYAALRHPGVAQASSLRDAVRHPRALKSMEFGSIQWRDDMRRKHPVISDDMLRLGVWQWINRPFKNSSPRCAITARARPAACARLSPPIPSASRHSPPPTATCCSTGRNARSMRAP